MYIIKEFVLIPAIGLFFFSCNHKKDSEPAIKQPSGILSLKTEFYDTSGNSIFMAPMKIWYYDSVAIEELVTIKSVTDTFKKTTVSIIPEAYRYIDLKNNSWYVYKTFTDTSRIVKSGVLPDTSFPDGGWTFYANNLPMKAEPGILPDTMIGKIKYKRIKFSRLNSPLSNSYIIGYLRCDNKGNLFSLEKDYSKKVNCTMTKFYEFKGDALKPFASSQLDFLSDTLSEKELKVFTAWKKNERNYPVH